MRDARSSRRTPRRHALVAAATAIVALAGCASTQLDAQWSDPQVAPGTAYLRGARVLVACDAIDIVVRQLCQDRVAGEVTARGGTAVFPAAETPILTDRSIDPQLLPGARAANAKALFVLTVAPASAEVSPGFQLGIGGFGFGGRSGVGVGAGIPIGGGRVTTGYTANGRVTDAGSGKLLWTARATSPPSSDLDAQLAELSKTVFGAADKSGLF